ncbi:glycosyltransferase family 4 protein [Winogradskya humida]|uniref:Glycosyl transferase family 1 n=1 Tax=Winogradskya humida TaxID=113566 RepID=A0ABQ4A5V7_9ACTN|nr:glycosyltransferase family 4 protein [Actinoplanes humidus]GIE26219.1 glycosyl transferase family 1 [Actinoplanes humidus]
MEILQVATFYPPHLGGEELVAQQLAGMQAHRHDVTVYASRVGAAGAPRREQHGRLRVVRDGARSLGNTPVTPRLLSRLIRHRPRPDIVHVHAGLAMTPEIVRLASWLRGIPYVVHLHLMVRPSSRAGALLLPVYQRVFYAGFLRHAARVICLTEAMRQVAITTFGLRPERVVVVPNGVDIDVFGSVAPQRRAERELLFVGRLTAQKNVGLLVEVMAALPPDVCLRIVGDGELREVLERRVAALGLANVRFEGRLSPDQLSPLYQRATAVLMPSTHEGLPLVLLEAMAAGAPVVCSALPELVEAGGDAVVAVAPLTPGKLAAVLLDLLGDPARRERLSHAARTRAAGYGWTEVAARVDAVYAQITAERR